VPVFEYQHRVVERHNPLDAARLASVTTGALPRGIPRPPHKIRFRQAAAKRAGMVVRP
jgi:hypothetical protein